MFTSLLLADMERRSELALNDPVAKYLPPEVKVPQRSGRQITLQDLATHTSGLPGDLSNINPQDPANPAADYTALNCNATLWNWRQARGLDALELPRDFWRGPARPADPLYMMVRLHGRKGSSGGHGWVTFLDAHNAGLL